MSASPHSLAANLEQAIRDATGTRFVLAPAPALTAPGGTATHAVLEGSGLRYFAKILPAAQLDRFEAEVDGLKAIARCDALRTPAVVATGSDDSHAWLILEWLDLRPVADRVTATRAAEAVAALHDEVGDHFGWHRDNYLGATPQSNAPSDSWARLFALDRLQRQFDLARNNGLDKAQLEEGERIVKGLSALFLDYRPCPSLVHGDLWHGNLAALPDGTPVTFDPACHYGDTDCDLAMAELFGGLPDDFYATYRRISPLADGYETRKLAYSLYHLLNHLNLFGKSYRSECARLISRLGRQLSR